jgi:hypothetical protein
MVTPLGHFIKMNIRKKEGVYFLVLLLAIIVLSYKPQLSPDCGDCTEWENGGCGLSGCEENEMKQSRSCTGDIFSDERPVMAGQGDDIVPLSPPRGPQFSLGEVPPECIKRCVIHEDCQEEEEEEEEQEEEEGSNNGGDNDDEEVDPPTLPSNPIELPNYPDLKITTNIDNLSKELHPGDIFTINIILENTGELNPVDVNLKCDLYRKNTSVLTLEEDYSLNTYKNLTKELTLPQNLTSGGYVLECFLTHEEFSDFQINTIIISNPPIINEESPLSLNLIEIVFLVLTLLTILIIIIIFIKRKRKTKKKKNGNRKNRTTKTTRRKHKKSSRRNKNVRRRK